MTYYTNMSDADNLQCWIYLFQTAYGMCETFIIAFTTLGDSEQEHDDRLQAKLFPKPNIKVRVKTV